MTHKLTETAVDEWLQNNAPHISLLEYGGTSHSKSKFKNIRLNVIFEKSVSKLKKQIKNGGEPGIGTGQNQSTTKTKEAAEIWLQNNAPHIQLVEWGGASSYRSTFYNNNINKQFVSTLAALRNNLNKGYEVGSGSRSNTFSLQQAQKALPDRIKLLEYNGAIDQSIFYDVENDREFSYWYTSLTSMLQRDKDFIPRSALSSLERKVEKFLDELNIQYTRQEVGKYRPDFVLPEHMIIIECDGLYWHSEHIVPDDYHQMKSLAYRAGGYRALFFREDEIIDSFDIVKSIIRNALELNENRYFARKCDIKSVDPSFFEEYHLMGKGSGKCFGLIYNDVLVSAIQVKWVNKERRELEISRFCSLPNTSVVGGFSKLLKHITELYQPNSIKTFIDLRYGTGGYLEKLGFNLENISKSFCWTKSQKCFHRMKFPGNTGYDYGFYKLWDCGQAKWIKYV